MENILQDINRNFISMSEDETKRNKRILSAVLTAFIEKMKEKDPLFKAMYKSVFYGGSFYDGLRVGKAEEFDLDLLLKLPEKACPDLSTSNIPGFVHLQLRNFDGWMKEETNPAYKNFGKFLDNKHYLCTDKVLAWIQSLIQRTMNDFPPKNGNSNKIRFISTNQGRFEIHEHEGGPARTLEISGSGMKMNVDLVACFIFGPEKWPKNGFKTNPVPSKPNFFIVPKKPKIDNNQPTPRYWRLSFQEQERVIIDNKRTLKPTVKLLKRLRDCLYHNCIASYYIKTVALHIVDEKNDEFWRNPLSDVFMTVLKEYKRFIEQKRIPYYWNKNNNLLGGINPITLDNVHNRLKFVIRDFENKPETIPGYFDYPITNNRNRNVNNNNTSNTLTTPENNSCNIS